MKYDYENKIKNGGYKQIIGVAENMLMRPNDTKLLLGEDKFNEMKKAVEKILEEDFKDDEVYGYYHQCNKDVYGFCSFERWKNRDTWQKTA
ncbi:hypothetical protein [Paenibacillus glucanolyticus]|uniref:hypothetical protein n=1 Tax=Paenibacillus glucanolyticus TaxID=59843 RepID=UPI00096BEA02|nr:hypothetical protein [Paenibacillus glucanolyticus]OMF76684.1 hypothetical protein BK142_14275 [Paenibacillus glucanolyticus]